MSSDRDWEKRKTEWHGLCKVGTRVCSTLTGSVGTVIAVSPGGAAYPDVAIVQWDHGAIGAMNDFLLAAALAAAPSGEPAS